jgi:hypothetical protein
MTEKPEKPCVHSRGRVRYNFQRTHARAIGSDVIRWYLSRGTRKDFRVECNFHYPHTYERYSNAQNCAHYQCYLVESKGF